MCSLFASKNIFAANLTPNAYMYYVKCCMRYCIYPFSVLHALAINIYILYIYTRYSPRHRGERQLSTRKKKKQKRIAKVNAIARAISGRVFHLHRLNGIAIFPLLLQMKAMTLLRLHGVCVRKGTLEQEWNRFLFFFHISKQKGTRYCIGAITHLAFDGRVWKSNLYVFAEHSVREIRAWCRCFAKVWAHNYQVNKHVFLHLQTFASSEMPSLQLNLLHLFSPSMSSCARVRNSFGAIPTRRRFKWELY